MTQDVGKMSEELRDALNKGLLKRLPLTFLPFVNQQIHEWDYLFPNERKSVQQLLLYVASLSEAQSAALFQDVVQLEEKMGVRHWQFSTEEQTIQNSSQLARSPYFQEWRKAVQAVFDASDKNATEAKRAGGGSRNRLVLLDLPKRLPVDPAKAWRHWQGIGKPLAVDLSSVGNTQSPFEMLLTGMPGAGGGHSGGLVRAAWDRPEASPAETWVVDAGRGAVDAVLTSEPSAATAPRGILLSHARLEKYRQSFSHEMNTMRKDLADADAVFDRLRKVDVTPWCPAEVAADPAIREFLRALYLSGNGAVIFDNSFVEWASSEALRRARPAFLAATFGVRSKPKPFTSVAVFDSPDQVNPLPAVDDPEGSSVDAQMLALYVWLAATRYEEYQRSTVCVCLAESIGQAYVVAPPEFALRQESGPVSLGRLDEALHAWIA
jgi:hypothetical protein